MADPHATHDLPDSLRELVPDLRRRYGDEAVDRQLEHLRRHGAAIDEPAIWLPMAVQGEFKFMPIEHVHRCLCGSSRSTLIARFVYWNLLATRRCDECGLLFVSPRLTAEVVRELFTETYFDHANLEFWGARRTHIFADVLRMLRRFDSRSMLDVGCAYGHFVKYAAERGLRASGCDISASAVRIGRERLGLELMEGSINQLDLPEGHFDSVVSLDTLYYAHDPIAELASMRRVVRAGGHIVLRLRNALGALARARLRPTSTVLRALLPSEHLWGFTPRSIGVILDANGWKVELYEPAAYSRTRLSALQTIALHGNRTARAAIARVPIFTRSFTVVARRVD